MSLRDVLIELVFLIMIVAALWSIADTLDHIASDGYEFMHP